MSALPSESHRSTDDHHSKPSDADSVARVAAHRMMDEVYKIRPTKEFTSDRHNDSAVTAGAPPRETHEKPTAPGTDKGATVGTTPKEQGTRTTETQFKPPALKPPLMSSMTTKERADATKVEIAPNGTETRTLHMPGEPEYKSVKEPTAAGDWIESYYTDGKKTGRVQHTELGDTVREYQQDAAGNTLGVTERKPGANPGETIWTNMDKDEKVITSTTYTPGPPSRHVTRNGKGEVISDVTFK